ncbi:MAG TPA: tRNA pseudouridine(38-40) synthase TruA [Pseudomonadales bacterium]
MTDTTPPPAFPATRIALGVEYDGSTFHGWQSQLDPALPTVQETLEAALSQVAAQRVTVICAGRTDTGVHAAGQVVHFDTTSVRQLKAWTLGANTALRKRRVSVRWAQEVPGDFHARFSAYSRRYRYTVCDDAVRPAMLSSFITGHQQRLDADAMHVAGQHLLGELDFSAYRGAGCQSNSPMRCVTELTVRRHGGLVVMDIEANAFLLHMVRNIMGTLIVIGEGRQSPQWAKELLDGRDRTRAAKTAPASGLSLVKVRYPSRFGLPETSSTMQQFPFFLPE